MEKSGRALGVFKGRIPDSRSWRGKLRLPNFEQIMEDEDWDEASVRYIGSKQTARADEGEGTQPRRMGKRTRSEEN